MIGIGVIGYGYWGPNLARNFMATPGAELRGVCDTSSAALKKAGSRCPGAKLYNDPQELLADTAIDAVAILTPVSTHFELASMALKEGKSVLATKPMTASVEEAERLVELAASSPGVLMVDHTFAYTGAVRKMKELLDQGTIGDVLYYDSVRVNLGLFQTDVNVIWDLVPHDASILEYLIPNQQPTTVSAHGIRHVPGQPENIAYVTLLYPDKLIAHMHVNWLAPVKIRQTLIGGSRKMIVYNDMDASEKIKVYDRGVELTEPEAAPEKIYQLRVGYRAGDMFAPKVAPTEALSLETKHFVECVEHGARPLTDGEAGLRVVRILEAATESMNTARPVELNQ